MWVKTAKLFLGCTTRQTTELYPEQTTLIQLHLALLGSQYAIIFSQPLVNVDFFTSKIIPPSSLSIEEFCLDIQKYVWKKPRFIFPKKKKKNALKNSGFKGNKYISFYKQLYFFGQVFCLLKLENHLRFQVA